MERNICKSTGSGLFSWKAGFCWTVDHPSIRTTWARGLGSGMLNQLACGLLCILLTGCSQQSGKQQNASNRSTTSMVSQNTEDVSEAFYVFEDIDTLAYVEEVPVGDEDTPIHPVLFDYWWGKEIPPPPFNYDRPLAGLSMEQLHFLKHQIYARKHYLFKGANERIFFEQYPWYQYVWWDPGYQFTLSPEEQAFIERVEEQQARLEERNYLEQAENEDAPPIPNVRNIVNRWMFRQLKPEHWQRLEEDGFVIVPTQNTQLFHTYEKNHYDFTPSYVTSDLYLQLAQYYFDYVKRRVESDRFIPVLKKLLNDLQQVNQKVIEDADQSDLRKAAEHNALYLNVAISLLEGTDRLSSVPLNLHQQFKDELEKCENANGQGSEFLDAPDFDYSQFAPQNHYLSSTAMKQYWRAKTWLQQAPFHLDNDRQLLAALLLAGYLQQNPALSGYANAYFIPLQYFHGFQANAALPKVQRLLQAKQISDLKGIKRALPELRDSLTLAIPVSYSSDQTNNTGTGGQDSTRRMALNFSPEALWPSEEIFSKLVHLEQDPYPLRPYPKGLDVMATLGVESAQQILFRNYQEAQIWQGYDDSLQQLQQKYDQNISRSGLNSDRFESLRLLFSVGENEPAWRQREPWQRRNLITALAVWANMHHDSYYPAQPGTVENAGLNDPVPAPIVLGYVEPNLAFWQKTSQTLEDLRILLENYNLLTEEIQVRTQEMQDLAQTLTSIVEKQITDEPRTTRDYKFLERIGGLVDKMTLNMLDAQAWNNIPETGRSVATIANVYSYLYDPTRKESYCLQVGNGYTQELYVVVEINDRMYLTRGSMLSYHEFTQSESHEMTDETWQQRLAKNDLPVVQKWIQLTQAPERGRYNTGTFGPAIRTRHSLRYNNVDRALEFQKLIQQVEGGAL